MHMPLLVILPSLVIFAAAIALWLPVRIMERGADVGGKHGVPKPPSYHPYGPSHLLTTKHALTLELPDKVMVYDIVEEVDPNPLSCTRLWHIHGCAHNKSFTVRLSGSKFPYEEALSKLRVFA
jgi:hypothetical protein